MRSTPASSRISQKYSNRANFLGAVEEAALWLYSDVPIRVGQPLAVRVDCYIRGLHTLVQTKLYVQILYRKNIYGQVLILCTHQFDLFCTPTALLRPLYFEFFTSTVKSGLIIG